MADIQQLEDSIVSLSLLEAFGSGQKARRAPWHIGGSSQLQPRQQAAAAQQRRPRSKRRPSSPWSSRTAARTRSATIKAVREVTALGLQRKPRTWSTALPKPLKENISKDDAAAIAKKFEGIATTVEIK